MKQKIVNDAPITKSNNYPTVDKLEIMFEKSERRMDEKARQYCDEILNKTDQILGILAQIREDTKN